MISPTLGASSWAAVGPGLRVVRVVEGLRTTWAASVVHILAYCWAPVGPRLRVVRVVEARRATSGAAVGPGLCVVERHNTWAAVVRLRASSGTAVGPGLCVVRVVERLRASDQPLEALPALAEVGPPNVVELMQQIQAMRPLPI